MSKSKSSLLGKFKDMKAHHQLLFSIVIGIAVISFWRGVWGLWDEYVLPGNYLLSSWISLIVGTIILIGTHYATRELM